VLAQLLCRLVTNSAETLSPDLDYNTAEVNGKRKIENEKKIYFPFSIINFPLILLFRFEFLRRGFFVFENAVEHFGAFGAARSELRVGLLLLIFQLVKFVGDVQRG
jgi:hypothetical protein